MIPYSDKSKNYLKELVRQGINSYKAFSYQNLSVNSGSVFTLNVPNDTKYCEIRVESSVTASVAMRYLITGSDPTSTDGMALNHLDLFDITDYQNIQNFKVVRTGAGTHNLHITYYK